MSQPTTPAAAPAAPPAAPLSPFNVISLAMRIRGGTPAKLLPQDLLVRFPRVKAFHERIYGPIPPTQQQLQQQQQPQHQQQAPLTFTDVNQFLQQHSNWTALPRAVALVTIRLAAVALCEIVIRESGAEFPTMIGSFKESYLTKGDRGLGGTRIGKVANFLVDNWSVSQAATMLPDEIKAIKEVRQWVSVRARTNPSTRTNHHPLAAYFLLLAASAADHAHAANMAMSADQFRWVQLAQPLVNATTIAPPSTMTIAEQLGTVFREYGVHDLDAFLAHLESREVIFITPPALAALMRLLKEYADLRKSIEDAVAQDPNFSAPPLPPFIMVWDIDNVQPMELLNTLATLNSKYLSLEMQGKLDNMFHVVDNQLETIGTVHLARRNESGKADLLAFFQIMSEMPLLESAPLLMVSATKPFETIKSLLDAATLAQPPAGPARATVPPPHHRFTPVWSQVAISCDEAAFYLYWAWSVVAGQCQTLNWLSVNPTGNPADSGMTM